MKKRSIIAAVILVVVGVIIFGAAFIASGFDFSKLDITKYETNTHSLSEVFEKIEIQLDEADITFKPSEDGKLRVDCVEREKVKHEVSVENGTLKIIAVDKRAWYDHLTLLSFKPQSITVYLPSDYYRVLKISSDTGDVSISDIFSFGDVEITASDADIVFNASSDGNLKIKTSTGDIKTIGSHATTIDLSASDGEIDINNVDCKETLSVKVSSGKANLTDVSCRSIISDGSTGDIVLKNVVAEKTISIVRSTGDVSFDRSDAYELIVATDTGDVTGSLLSAKVFIVHSDTGMVDVPETTSGGKCKLTSDTGDIKINILN